ncbi:hypothetical protein MAR_024208 [Mya arenaria]|uniref:Uncharacterized protein n=1 Tax=Mya arenaria TaxID=6604 RepID=A0ABY7DU05_MYAAR|nr:uncharacterized protein LOC128228395 [Mya arenaria]WAQ99835.1 hypothetical protein MAR_024208 [Mya arenaria]
MDGTCISTAPCPPPFVNVYVFYVHAVSRNLSIQIIHDIAEQCGVPPLNCSDIQMDQEPIPSELNEWMCKPQEPPRTPTDRMLYFVYVLVAIGCFIYWRNIRKGMGLIMLFCILRKVYSWFCKQRKKDADKTSISVEKECIAIVISSIDISIQRRNDVMHIGGNGVLDEGQVSIVQENLIVKETEVTETGSNKIGTTKSASYQAHTVVPETRPSEKSSQSQTLVERNLFFSAKETSGVLIKHQACVERILIDKETTTSVERVTVETTASVERVPVYRETTASDVCSKLKLSDKKTVL